MLYIGLSPKNVANPSSLARGYRASYWLFIMTDRRQLASHFVEECTLENEFCQSVQNLGLLLDRNIFRKLKELCHAQQVTDQHLDHVISLAELISFVPLCSIYWPNVHFHIHYVFPYTGYTLHYLPPPLPYSYRIIHDPGEFHPAVNHFVIKLGIIRKIRSFKATFCIYWPSLAAILAIKSIANIE